MTKVTDIINQARTWLNTPFHHQARLKGHGCDCLGLVIGVADELGLKDKCGQPFTVHDEITYSREPDGAYFMARLMALLEEVPLAEAQVGDLALFAVHNNPQHVAFITDYEGMLGMIHCDAQTRRVVEHRLDDNWKNRLVKVFRWQ